MRIANLIHREIGHRTLAFVDAAGAAFPVAAVAEAAGAALPAALTDPFGYRWLAPESRARLAGIAGLFDCGPNIKMAKIAAGCALPGATPAGHRAVFLLEGDLAFGEQVFDTLSYFILPGGEEHPALEAVSDATLLTIGWSPEGDKVPFDLF